MANLANFEKYRHNGNVSSNLTANDFMNHFSPNQTTDADYNTPPEGNEDDVHVVIEELDKPLI